MTSATGKSRCPAQAGQTLLELLLTLALIVLVLGGAVATLGGGRARPPADVAVDDIAATFQRVRRAAVSEGRTLALLWMPDPPALSWREATLTLPVHEGVRLTLLDGPIVGAAAFEIFFRPDGSCDSVLIVVATGTPTERRWRVDPWTARLTPEELRR